MNQILKNCSKKEIPLKQIKDNSYFDALKKAEKVSNSKKVKKDYKLEKKALEKKEFINKIINDQDNEEHIQDIERIYYGMCTYNNHIIGTHSIEKERKAKIDKVIWRFIIIFILIPIIYIVIINSFNI